MIKSQRKKILVVGASGYIGQSLCLKIGAEICLATFNQCINLKNYFKSHQKFDLVRDDPSVLNLEDVSHAVILSGVTNPDKCVRESKLSELVNVHATIRLLDYLGENNVVCIFASSEVVFDGGKGSYIESDTTNPIMLYGLQKKIIEEHIENNWPRAAVIRLAKVYGSTPGDGSLLDNWYCQALAGAKIRCADDYISSVVHIDDVVNAILAIIERGLSGIYHIGGPRAVSRYEMCDILMKLMSEKSIRACREIVPCSIDEFETLEKRPKDVSLNTSKLVKDAKVNMRSIEQSCREFITRIF